MGEALAGFMDRLIVAGGVEEGRPALERCREVASCTSHSFAQVNLCWIRWDRSTRKPQPEPGLSGLQGFYAKRRRSIQANPSRPVASSRRLAGSGVVATLSTSVRVPEVAS